MLVLILIGLFPTESLSMGERRIDRRCGAACVVVETLKYGETSCRSALAGGAAKSEQSNKLTKLETE